MTLAPICALVKNARTGPARPGGIAKAAKRFSNLSWTRLAPMKGEAFAMPVRFWPKRKRNIRR